MERVRFRSRIDVLLAALFFVPTAIACVIVIRHALTRGTTSSTISAALSLLVLGLAVWLFLSTYYQLTDTMLLVRSGPMRWSVPLAQITRVSRTNSILSAPALSLRRLEICYGTQVSLLISPADEAGFLKALHARAPSAQLPASAR